jgi:thioredoxin 1
MANLPQVNDATFDAEVMKSDKPVVVDFSATWCGPCKQLAPTIEALAGDYDGRVKFVMVDIDHAPKTTLNFNVMSVPTLLFISKGQVLNQMLGNRSRTEIARALDSVLEG